jgi:hypothetical protein
MKTERSLNQAEEEKNDMVWARLSKGWVNNIKMN